MEILEYITLADEAGLDVFGIGEHHNKEFLDSTPAVICRFVLYAGQPQKTKIYSSGPFISDKTKILKNCISFIETVRCRM